MAGPKARLGPGLFEGHIRRRSEGHGVSILAHIIKNKLQLFLVQFAISQHQEENERDIRDSDLH